MSKLRNFRFSFSQKINEYSISASPTPPIKPETTTTATKTTNSSDQIVKFVRGYKRKQRKISSTSSGNSNGNNYIFSSKYGTNHQNSMENRYKPKDFVNLFSIFGNILASDEGKNKLLHRKRSNESKESEIKFSAYPLDDNLIILLENSVRCWYSNSSINTKIPAILSIQTPNRNFTWELGKHLALKSGNSNLALIPFSMFLELLETCLAVNRKKSNNFNSEEAKVFGDYLLKNITNRSEDLQFKNQTGFHSRNSEEWISNFSKAMIQVFDYLFICAETSLGKRETKIPIPSFTMEKEKFTILLDGLEEYLLERKGGDIVIKNLINWANLSESSGRKIILGTRTLINSENLNLNLNLNFNENEQEIDNEDDENEHEMSSNNKNRNNKSDRSLELLTEVLLKLSLGGLKNLLNDRNSSSSLTNVLMDENFLRVSANGPKNDKRKLLKYSQLIVKDRQRDLFDLNLSNLRSMALNQWNINLKLENILTSKHEFPSSYPEIWEKLSSVGRGILIKKKLTSEEFSEIILYSLGIRVSNDSNSHKSIEIEFLGEAIDNLSKIRHDPTKFSSDDLNNLLEEREIPINSLTKYEKRFINCISTSTTQTKFKDISLPNETVETLKALTTLPLSHPELFTQGILKSSLSGVLLFGPPGTGKTMLARAVAEESGAAFLAVNMSNILDMYVGEGEKNIQGLFSLARKLSPSIIFIDEIDSLLERRSSSSISGKSNNRLEIINEFMSQWDGLSSNLNCGVIVMGATNRPFVLDDAVLRRLPRRLLIDLPGPKNRQKILSKLLSENLCENDLIEGIPEFAHKMEFYSGSDLKNVAISAALKSAIRLANGNNITNINNINNENNENNVNNENDSFGELIISKKDFEEALREIPASLSDQMDSLVELRKWNQIYGESRDSRQKIKFGFA